MRTVIVAGCRVGKSTLARKIHDETGAPIFCGDPIDKVKDFERGVTYLPSGLGFGSPASQWIVDEWLPMPGPWVLEGHITARVLRKWIDQSDPYQAPEVLGFPCDRVIVLTNEPWVELLPGQSRLNEAVEEQWRQVSCYFEPITEIR